MIVIGALFVLAALPFATILFLRSMRNPIGVALACYAAVLPFGSGVTVRVGLPSPFNTASTLVGLWVIVVVGLFLAQSRRWAPVHSSVPVWLILLALVVASDAWSVDPHASLSNAEVFVSLVLLFVLVSLVRTRTRDVRLVEMGAIIGGVSACVYGLVLLNTGRLTTADGSVPRFATAGGGGETADPNITAASLLLPALLALTWALRARTWRGRALGFAVLGLMATGIVLTGSRGGALAGVVGCIVVIASERGWRKLLPFGVVLAGVVAIAFVVAPGALGNRFTQTGSTGRTDLWRVGAQACPTYCLRGSGWATFPDVYLNTLLTNVDLKGHGAKDFKAHNIALAMVIEMGVAGLVLAATGLFLVARSVVRLRQPWRGPPLAALLAVLTANMFLSNFNFKYFWFVLTYCVLVVGMDKRDGEGAPATSRGAASPDRTAASFASSHTAGSS